MSSISSLPKEIWHRILTETDIRSICILSITTKKIHVVLEDDYFWKMKTRHDFGCFKESDGKVIFPGVFKETLYFYNNSWKNFYFAIQHFLDLIFGENRNYKISGEFPKYSSYWTLYISRISRLLFTDDKEKFLRVCNVIKCLLELGVIILDCLLVCEVTKNMNNHYKYEYLFPILKIIIKLGVNLNTKYTVPPICLSVTCYNPVEVAKSLIEGGAIVVDTRALELAEQYEVWELVDLFKNNIQ